MRALFLTNHFTYFAGSELVVLELAEALGRLGYDVDIRAAVVGPPIVEKATEAGIQTSTLDGKVDVSGYNIVWCQHGTLGNIEPEGLNSCSRPLIVTAHLSPFEPLELIAGSLEEGLPDMIAANSNETAKVIRSLYGRQVDVFSNGAPSEYFLIRSHSDKLRRLLCVSNHLPEEMREAIRQLRAEHGITVTILGILDRFQRLCPHDLLNHDAIMTMGKSVQCAIATRTPAFIYGRFGGSGWLDAAQFAENKWHNFSGRPASRKLSAGALVDEIRAGYSAAVDFASSLDAATLTEFALDPFVQKLHRMCKERREPIQLSEAACRRHQQSFYAIHALQRERRTAAAYLAEADRARAELHSRPPSVEQTDPRLTNLEGLVDQIVGITEEFTRIAAEQVEIAYGKQRIFEAQAAIEQRDRRLEEAAAELVTASEAHAREIEQLKSAGRDVDTMRQELARTQQEFKDALADRDHRLAALAAELVAAREAQAQEIEHLKSARRDVAALKQELAQAQGEFADALAHRDRRLADADAELAGCRDSHAAEVESLQVQASAEAAKRQAEIAELHQLLAAANASHLAEREESARGRSAHDEAIRQRDDRIAAMEGEASATRQRIAGIARLEEQIARMSSTIEAQDQALSTITAQFAMVQEDLQKNLG